MTNLALQGRLAASAADAKAMGAVLKIDSLDLLIPQGEIRTLESVSDVEWNDPAERSVGWINFQQQRWPVYGLSSQLELQNNFPASRRTCVLLALASGYVGVLCDDVEMLRQVGGQLYNLPVAMRRDDTPIHGVISYKQGIACVSDANRLAAHIRQQVQSS